MDASWALRVLLAVVAIVVLRGAVWPETAALILLWLVTFAWKWPLLP